MCDTWEPEDSILDKQHVLEWRREMADQPPAWAPESATRAGKPELERQGFPASSLGNNIWQCHQGRAKFISKAASPQADTAGTGNSHSWIRQIDVWLHNKALDMTVRKWPGTHSTQ